MDKQILATDGAPAAVGPYSQGVRIGDLVYTAGQLGLVPGTKQFAGGTVAEQTEQALKNISAILQAAGTSLRHVVKVTVLLADISYFSEMNTAYSAFFPEEPPARAAFGASGLPLGGLVEIEAIAVLPG